MEDEELQFRIADHAELLLQKQASENCPGCKTSYLRKPGGQPPKRALVGVALLSIVNALTLTSLYPFIYFMVHDFHIAKSDDSVGYYVGLVGSSFMLGRFLTSAFWGVISDQYGRKVVIYIGVVSIIIFNTSFGLSTNFWMALASRFFLGVFNGILPAVQIKIVAGISRSGAWLQQSLVDFPNLPTEEHIQTSWYAKGDCQ